MKFILAVTAIFLLFSFPVSADAPKQQHEEMLYPTVLVTTGTGRGSGSGTVIYSEMNGGEWES